MTNDGNKIDKKRDFFDISGIFAAPFAPFLTKALLPTRITSLQVTWAMLLVGLAGASCILLNSWTGSIAAAIMLQAKNILDSVDGRRARARNKPSRIGRFLDSIVDFWVSFAYLAAMAWIMHLNGFGLWIWPAAGLALVSSLFQGSFYVYYMVNFLAIRERSSMSRVDETITEEDRHYYDDEKMQRRLNRYQGQFRIIYGWQDRLINGIDSHIRKRSTGFGDEFSRAYFSDRKLLTAASLLGLGSQLALISLALAFRQYPAYIIFMLTFCNLYALSLLLFRFLRYKNYTAGNAERNNEALHRV
jgi:phosphatidylglycerophosphate synthase